MYLAPTITTKAGTENWAMHGSKTKKQQRRIEVDWDTFNFEEWTKGGNGGITATTEGTNDLIMRENPSPFKIGSINYPHGRQYDQNDCASNVAHGTYQQRLTEAKTAHKTSDGGPATTSKHYLPVEGRIRTVSATFRSTSSSSLLGDENDANEASVTNATTPTRRKSGVLSNARVMTSAVFSSIRPASTGRANSRKKSVVANSSSKKDQNQNAVPNHSRTDRPPIRGRAVIDSTDLSRGLTPAKFLVRPASIGKANGWRRYTPNIRDRSNSPSPRAPVEIGACPKVVDVRESESGGGMEVFARDHQPSQLEATTASINAECADESESTYFGGGFSEQRDGENTISTRAVVGGWASRGGDLSRSQSAGLSCSTSILTHSTNDESANNESFLGNFHERSSSSPSFFIRPLPMPKSPHRRFRPRPEMRMDYEIITPTKTPLMPKSMSEDTRRNDSSGAHPIGTKNENRHAGSQERGPSRFWRETNPGSQFSRENAGTNSDFFRNDRCEGLRPMQPPKSLPFNSNSLRQHHDPRSDHLQPEAGTTPQVARVLPHCATAGDSDSGSMDSFVQMRAVAATYVSSMRQKKWDWGVQNSNPVTDIQRTSAHIGRNTKEARPRFNRTPENFVSNIPRPAQQHDKKRRTQSRENFSFVVDRNINTQEGPPKKGDWCTQDQESFSVDKAHQNPAPEQKQATPNRNPFFLIPRNYTNKTPNTQSVNQSKTSSVGSTRRDSFSNHRTNLAQALPHLNDLRKSSSAFTRFESPPSSSQRYPEKKKMRAIIGNGKQRGNGQSSSSTSSKKQQRQSHSNAGAKKRIWKTAVDPKSGRTYYYDAITRETQWRKPIELATDAERRAIREKERKQLEFFRTMENNILKCMAAGVMPGTPKVGEAQTRDEEREGLGDMCSNTNASLSTKKTDKKGASIKKAKLVRTISSMDNDLLAQLTHVDGDDSVSLSRKNRPSDNPDPSPCGVNEFPAAVSSQQSVRSPLERPFSSSRVLGSQFESPAPSSVFDDDAVLHRQRESQREDRAIAQVRRAAAEMSALDTTTPLNDSLRITKSDETPALVPPKESATPVVAKSNSSGDSPTHGRATTDLRLLAKPSFAKRNTCGTIYVGSTMSAPDKDATIKCVCGVYRAHMLNSAREEAASGPTIKFDEYEIFNDMPGDRQSVMRKKKPTGSGNQAGLSIMRASPVADDAIVLSPSAVADELGVEVASLSVESSIDAAIPSLDEITNFYRDVFRRSQMESDCIIMSLVYIERLIRETNGGVRPRVGNWRSVLFASMVMSSKVWDDMSMWNADFSQTCPAGVKFSLRRINELELAMLECLKYNVKVKASEYAKYYFLLRSMMIRSGLAGDELSSMSPLDVEGARRLQHVSSNFQSNATTKAELLGQLRSKSVGEVEEEFGRGPNVTTNTNRGNIDKGEKLDAAVVTTKSESRPSSRSNSPKAKSGVSLEQMVQM